MKLSIIQTDRIFPVVGIIAALALLAASTSPAWAEDTHARQPAVFPPHSHPFGASYAEWSARWWRWTLAFPADADPASDTAPQTSSQSGPVWFLAGAHGSAVVGGTAIVNRQLVVPEGKALFFPALTAWSDNSGCPVYSSFSVDELRGQVMDLYGLTSEISCTVDGLGVEGLQDPQTTPYLVESSVFSYTVASHDNLLAAVFGEPCIPDGTTIAPAVAVGAFLMLAPLPPGPHSVHFVGIVGPLASPFVDFDLTYDIIVTREHRARDRDQK